MTSLHHALWNMKIVVTRLIKLLEKNQYAGADFEVLDLLWWKVETRGRPIGCCSPTQHLARWVDFTLSPPARETWIPERERVNIEISSRGRGGHVKMPMYGDLGNKLVCVGPGLRSRRPQATTTHISSRFNMPNGRRTWRICRRIKPSLSVLWPEKFGT